MYLKESIQEKIAQILFGMNYSQLTPLWQGKVVQIADSIYVEVIKPLRLINSTLVDVEISLQKEIKDLHEQILHLEYIIKKL
jgi:hypothetical protein